MLMPCYHERSQHHQLAITKYLIWNLGGTSIKIAEIVHVCKIANIPWDYIYLSVYIAIIRLVWCMTYP